MIILTIIHYIGNRRVTIDDLISLTPFKGCHINEIIEAVERTWITFKDGKRGSDLTSPLEMVGFSDPQIDLILDIARCRKKACEKSSLGDSLFFTSEGLRWATPEPAARHCASRLKTGHVMDITCGQGGQALHFALTSEKVTAVDLDPLNCVITHMNAVAMGADGLEIINGDSLSEDVKKLATEGCYIFCDPARPPGSTERKMDEIHPDPVKVHELYSKLSAGICFEIPPYMHLKHVPFEKEAEYVSYRGRLNRLNIYTGDLKLSSRSVVSLPDGEMIRGDPTELDVESEEGLTKGNHISEIDQALIRSGLTHLLKDRTGGSVIKMDERRYLLSTSAPAISPFIGRSALLLRSSIEEKDLKRSLESVGAGSVTIRYKVDPSEYWNVRKEYESGLSGKLKVDLYKGSRYHIALREE